MSNDEATVDPQSGQRLEVHLRAEDVASLPRALGWNEPQTLNELRDTSGNLIVKDGEPTPDCEHLVRSFTEQKAAITVLRSDASGAFAQHMLWLGARGTLWAVQEPDGMVLRSGPGGASFRVLIDMLGLGPRPAPQPGFEPVKIPAVLLQAADNYEQGPDGPAQARTEIAAAVRPIAPQIADCLQIGDGHMVTFVAEWDGAQGHQNARLIYFDTPAGLLFHTQASGFLRQRHYLEPAPSWLVWAMIVGRLPEPADVEHWLAETG